MGATAMASESATAGARRYTLGEEIAHSITHGVGALASIAGLVVLVVSASLHGNAWHIVSCSIFGTTLVLMYTASTLYHALPQPRAKRVFRVLDHSAIYLLIAGTYTPFTLVSLRGAWGWTLFGLVWAMAIPGIVFKALALGRLRVLSVVFYLAMGWLVVVAARPLVHAVPRPGLMLIAAGGLAYTVGVVFFAWKRMPYHHMIWHLFVLAGSALHFLAILLYVVPRSGSPA
ncbi:MAG: hemolysin III family protein [Thermoanaerobaculales bacterium]